MKLARVALENFRGIRHLELPLDSHMNILVGENAAGKTSLLDGIAIGLAAITQRFPGVGGIGFKKGDLQRFTPDRTQPNLFGEEQPLRWLNRPYMRVELESIDGIAWDRTERRDQTQHTRQELPKLLGLKRLQERIDPLIEAIEADSAAAVELPVLVYYGTERAVLNLPQRMRNLRKEFTRYSASDHPGGGGGQTRNPLPRSTQRRLPRPAGPRDGSGSAHGPGQSSLRCRCHKLRSHRAY